MRRDIPGYEGYYVLTPEGVAYSVDRVVEHGRLGTIRLRGRKLTLKRSATPEYWLSRDSVTTTFTVEALLRITYPEKYADV